ncbi:MULTISPECIES: hypothetical protein [unclassified Janthinobacterium]|nr:MULTISPECIES: hypothetical protein [unclassified Janthinobacterium]
MPAQSDETPESGAETRNQAMDGFGMNGRKQALRQNLILFNSWW